ncbi:MAG: hypothetical protein N2688_13360, partial [Burkholderiaceae bacterium]|nr:hypothetical protein [Burkholderiaceae bacterium]
LYVADTSQDGIWNGAWGLLRTLSRRDPGDRLVPLPANPRPTLLAPLSADMRRNDCPQGAPLRQYHLVAELANRLLPPADNVRLRAVGGVDPNGGTLVYNPRTTEIRLQVFHDQDDPTTPEDERRFVKEERRFGVGPLHDPTAILIVRAEDLDPDTGRLKSDAPVEPIVLRAAAGDCVEVTLENRLPASRREMPDLAGFTTLSMLMPKRVGSGPQEHTSFNNNHVRPSNHIGLHPQMVHYDVQLHDASAVGLNRPSLAGPGETIRYKWFAGELTFDAAQSEAARCTLAEGSAGGLPLLNLLRAHERTVDGERLLMRPPNQLFTLQTLVARLERLLVPNEVDVADPAPDDVQRIAPPERVLTAVPPLRPLPLDPELRAQLSRLRAETVTPRLTKTPPARISPATFDEWIARAVKALLAQPAAVQRCLDSPRGAPDVPVSVPEEVAVGVRAILGERVVAEALQRGPAGSGREEESFSLVQALERRERCARETRGPMVEALTQELADTPLAQRAQAVAQRLAASIAYLVPSLDEDALGSPQFEKAFSWYRTLARESLTPETTQLVVPDRRTPACRFTAIEYGSTNLTPPDRIKQGQKGAVGALVIEPQGSLWWELDVALDRQNPATAGGWRRTRTAAHVFYPARISPGTGAGNDPTPSDWRYLRDLVVVFQKGLNLRYGQAAPWQYTAVGPLAAERTSAHQPFDRVAPEDAHDAGHMAVNYGTEPMWFRFGTDPSAPFGHGPSVSSPWPPGEGFGAIRDAHRAFANVCCQAPDGRTLPA